jgi:hypothetical protein
MRHRVLAGLSLTVVVVAVAVFIVVRMGAMPAGKWHACVNLFEKDSGEPGEFPNCILRSGTGNGSVSPRFLKRLTFGDFGLAAILSADEGWMYVNRPGAVVVWGVAQYDNGPDPFQHGLVRIVRGEKWGLADYTGKVIVPPIYDGAMNSPDERPRVCMGCRKECLEGSGCEHQYLAGGTWLYLDAARKLVTDPGR